LDGGGGGSGDWGAGAGAAAVAKLWEKGVSQPGDTRLPSPRSGGTAAGAGAASLAVKRSAPGPALGGDAKKYLKKADQEFIDRGVKFGAQPSAAVSQTMKVIKGTTPPRPDVHPWS
jgi:hypothetical protein